ncbi:MAG: hypothetical protein ACK40Q_02685 [Pseudothermotoga sp.]
MRELIVLLKYGLAGSTNSLRKSRDKKKRSISTLFFPIIAVGVYGLPLGFLFTDFFKAVKDITVGETNLAALFVASWSVLMAGMFILSFVPSLVNSFVKNEEIQLLLAMPVRRSMIMLYQAVLTLILQSFAVVMYLFIVPAYAIATGKNLFMSILTSFLMCFVLFLVSICLAALLGIWMERSTARRMNILSLLLTVILFLIIIQSLPNMGNTSTGVQSILTQTGVKVFSKFNPLIWPILALDNFLYVIPLFLTGLVLWFISLRISEKIAFENREKTHTMKREKTVARSSVFSKDLRLLLRYEQGIFMLIYPVAVSLIFAFTTKSFVSPLFISIIVSTMYVSMSSAMLIKQEFVAWPLAKIMPLTSSQILMPKMIIPASLYSFILIILVLFLKVYFALSWAFYSVVPIVFVMYVFASILGIHFFMKEKQRGMISNPSKVLNTPHVFTVEGIVLATTFGSVLPLTMYLYNRHLLLVIFKKEIFVGLIGIGLPISLTFILIFLIRKYFKQLFSIIDETE